MFLLVVLPFLLALGTSSDWASLLIWVLKERPYTAEPQPLTSNTDEQGTSSPTHGDYLLINLMGAD